MGGSWGCSDNTSPGTPLALTGMTLSSGGTEKFACTAS